MPRHCGRLLPAAAVLLVGCTDPTTPNPAPAEPSFAIVAASGRVLTPTGGNICNQFAPGTSYRLSFFRVVDGGTDVNAGASNIMTCPANQWSHPTGLEEGRYVVRIATDFAGFAAGAINSRYPRSAFDTILVAGPTVRDVVARQGRRIGGGATLGGVPVAGATAVSLTTLSDVLNTNFGAVGVSNADGTWDEWNPATGMTRPDLYLQEGLTYQNFGCGAARGTRTQSMSVSPFVVARGTRLDCRLVTAPERRWTHLETQLAVTPGPARITPFAFGSNEQSGFGVQYPVTDTIPDRSFQTTRMHLFEATFLISVDDSVMLSGHNVSSALACAPSCTDLTPTSATPTGARTAADPAGTRAVWQVSDALSPESKGMVMTQTSWDGTGGAYVLFRLGLYNSGAQGRTVRVGFMADWDVAGSSQQSIGFAGDVAWTTSTTANTPFLGSVFMGAYQNRGMWAMTGAGFLSLPLQIDIMQGDITSLSISNQDIMYVQSVGPISIPPGGTRRVWFALLAGQTLAELQANATLAAADMAARQ